MLTETSFLLKLKFVPNIFVECLLYLSYFNGCCPHTQWDSDSEQCIGKFQIKIHLKGVYNVLVQMKDIIFILK